MRSIEREFSDCGQQAMLIDSAMLEELRQHSAYKGAELPSAMLDGAEKMLAMTLRHDAFFCGLVKMKMYKGYIWFPLFFFDDGEVLHRVSILNARCLKCDWRGLAADPTVPYLFDGVADRFHYMRQAATLETVPCPSCGSKLDHHGMHAVWVHSAEKE